MSPKPQSQPSNASYPAGEATKLSVPSTPPTWSTAAATWSSPWVSTPPVTGRAASMVVMAIPSSPYGQGVARPSREGVTVGPEQLPLPGPSPLPERGVPLCKAEAIEQQIPAGGSPGKQETSSLVASRRERHGWGGWPRAPRRRAPGPPGREDWRGPAPAPHPVPVVGGFVCHRARVWPPRPGLSTRRASPRCRAWTTTSRSR